MLGASFMCSLSELCELSSFTAKVPRTSSELRVRAASCLLCFHWCCPQGEEEDLHCCLMTVSQVRAADAGSSVCLVISRLAAELRVTLEDPGDCGCLWSQTVELH